MKARRGKEDNNLKYRPWGLFEKRVMSLGESVNEISSMSQMVLLRNSRTTTVFFPLILVANREQALAAMHTKSEMQDLR